MKNKTCGCGQPAEHYVYCGEPYCSGCWARLVRGQAQPEFSGVEPVYAGATQRTDRRRNGRSVGDAAWWSQVTIPASR